MNARRALGIMFLSSNAMTLVHFVVTLVLARILSPSDVGIFSMTVMFANIAALFRDFGVSAYLQREAELDADKRASALTFLLASSWSTALVMYLISDLVAQFFGEPGVGRVMRVFCLSFLVVPFASYFFGLLARDLKAGRQAMVSAVGTAAYGVCCLALAALDFGYMSLAWANLANISASIVAYLVMRTGPLPRRLSFKHWRGLMHFGGGTLVGALLDKVNQSVPDLILGKLSGAHDVGLFSRANGLMGLFGQMLWPAVGYTTLPFLARAHHDGQPLGPLIIRGVSIVCVLGWPVYFGLALFAHDVIHVLYGDQWLTAAPVASILALGFAVRLPVCLSTAALTAVGRPYLAGQAAAIDLTARVAAVWISGVNELWQFALAIAVADAITTLFPLWQMRRYLGMRLRELARGMGLTLKASFFPCAALSALKLQLPSDLSAGWVILIVIPIGAVAWLVGLRLTQHPILSELRPLVHRLLPSSAKRWTTHLLG